MDRSQVFPSALVFDMDGVLIDSNPFHLQKWARFLDERGVPYTRQELMKHVLGHHSEYTFRYFFGDRFANNKITQLSNDFEASFRQAFGGHIKPLPGLVPLLTECHAASIPMAVASSAIGSNVEFIVDALGFRPYFRCIVSADHVQYLKPHPEIYLRTVEMLGFPPSACIAFEDSTVGIESAKAARLFCVAIASTISADKLRRHGQADLIVESFEELNLERLRALAEVQDG